MPLEIYPRGEKWWLKGRSDRIAGGPYYRQSLGAPVTMRREDAEAALKEFEDREVKRHIFGDEAVLTFNDAVLLYNPPPADATYLKTITDSIGDTLVSKIKPGTVRSLAAELYPDASTDTWQRQVITPIRSVINNAHDKGHCAPIRIRGFTKAERLKQDRKRGKKSRVPKTPGSVEWINEFRKHANHRLGSMALFMFTTAARIGQTVLINDSTDLDLKNNRVFLPEAKGHEAQWIDLLPEVAEDLKRLTPRNGRLFGYLYRWSVYKPWQKACERGGIEYIPPHAAGRHGFGTEMIVRGGLDPVTAAREGRWSTPVVPLKTYSHAENSTARVHKHLRTKLVQLEK